eukprot:6166849-Pleurochrysis_carterae.AAC.1
MSSYGGLVLEKAELQKVKEEGLLMEMPKGAPGLVDNRSGGSKADVFSTAHEGGRGGIKTVGVVSVGLEAENKVAGEAIATAHRVCSSAFNKQPIRRRRESLPEISQQDRLEFHTFRRGDVVKYLPALASDPIKEAEQGCKMLVLYDAKCSAFVLGLWTEWQRVHIDSATSNVDNNETAKTMDAAAYMHMTQAWSVSAKELKDLSSL